MGGRGPSLVCAEYRRWSGPTQKRLEPGGSLRRLPRRMDSGREIKEPRDAFLS